MTSIVKVDTIQENTSANGITVDGLNIKDSKLVTANSVVTSNITDANVTLAKLAGDSVDATKIADNAISEEHLDVTSITGHTAETSIADGDTILIHDASASALRKMTKANFVSGIGGANTPAFSAKGTGTNSSPNTATKVAYASENFDSDGKYDTSTSRFTPTVDGKYFIEGRFRFGETSDITGLKISIYKNGSAVKNHQVSNTHNETVSISGIIDLDTDDYVEIFFSHNHSGTSGTVSDDSYNTFEGFKLIT